MVIAGMEMPPGLDLLLFSACATTRGVRSVPIPLLKKARRWFTAYAQTAAHHHCCHEHRCHHCPTSGQA